MEKSIDLKSRLLAGVGVAAIALSLCATVHANVGFDADLHAGFSRCGVPSEPKEDSLREKIGNGLRCFGHWLRTDSDKETAAGQVKVAAQQAVLSAFAYKTGFSLSESVWKPVGNAFRWLGQQIKGGTPTDTPERVMTEAIVKQYASHGKVLTKEQLETALIGASEALFANTKYTLADQTLIFKTVISKLQDRGFSVAKDVKDDELQAKGVLSASLKAKQNQTFAEYFENAKNTIWHILKGSLEDLRAFVQMQYDALKAILGFEARRNAR